MLSNKILPMKTNNFSSKKDSAVHSGITNNSLVWILVHTRTRMQWVHHYSPGYSPGAAAPSLDIQYVHPVYHPDPESCGL